MIKTKTLATCLASVSLVSSIATPAFAATTDASIDSSRNGGTAVASSPLAELVKGVSTTVFLVSEDSYYTLKSSNPAQTLDSLLEQNGYSSNDYRTSDNKPVDGNTLLGYGGSLVLLKNTISSNSETITLNAPEETKETDTLYKGETKVETEGSNGTAIKTTVSKTLVPGQDNSTSTTEEKLTIVQAPVAKVTLVGTKERPQAQESFTGSRYGSYTYDPAREKEILESTNPDAIKAVELARLQVGKPYRWGSAGGQDGAFDCSGLVYWIYKINLGYNIPRTAYDIGRSATQINDVNDLRPGDILYTKSHIVLFAGWNENGEGKVIHAANPRRGVVEDKVDYFLRSGYRIARIAN